jgi:hypothetical protein
MELRPVPELNQTSGNEAQNTPLSKLCSKEQLHAGLSAKRNQMYHLQSRFRCGFWLSESELLHF